MSKVNLESVQRGQKDPDAAEQGLRSVVHVLVPRLVSLYAPSGTKCAKCMLDKSLEAKASQIG